MMTMLTFLTRVHYTYYGLVLDYYYAPFKSVLILFFLHVYWEKKTRVEKWTDT